MSTLMNRPYFYFIAIAISIVSFMSTLSISNAYTFDLLHLPLSPRSPSYDPSTVTHTQRVARALQGSGNNNVAIEISVDIQNGAYYVVYSIGSPRPVTVSGNLIAGSDLIWLPCKTSDFNRSKSKTYRRIACPSNQCNSLPATSCSADHTCNYHMSYADGSSNSGDFSTDTVRFGSSRTLEFGCATKYDNRAMPSVGLGRGKLSLVQQLRATRFSYCLVPFSSRKTKSGKLSIGSNAGVFGRGAVSTPLIQNRKSPTFYYVNLESITIESTTLRFGGDIVVELGTLMTLLPRALYWSVIGALKKSMPPENMIRDGQSDLCYSKIASFPSVGLRFKDAKGGEVAWKAENVFAQMGENKYCVAFGMAADGADAIYGSFAQANFVVGFDLVENTVNFKPATC